MGRRLSRDQFLRVTEELRQDGPEVKYHNPDGWISHLLKQMIEEEMKKKQRGHTE